MHEWVVCIGILYGTTLWQIGDAEGNSRCFKRSLVNAKKILMQKKNAAFLPTELVATNVIFLLNYAWEYSFTKEAFKKEAICDRGWFPYSWNLILHPELVATMTREEKCAAIDQELLRLKNKLSANAILQAVTLPNFNFQFLIPPFNADCNLLQWLNFGSDVAYSTVEKLIGHKTLMQKKEEMKKRTGGREMLKEGIKEGKRLTAGLIF